jgi:hypothetical protein
MSPSSPNNSIKIRAIDSLLKLGTWSDIVISSSN